MIRKMFVVLLLGAILVTALLLLKQPTKTITIGEYEAMPHIDIALDVLNIEITSSPDDKIHVQIQGHNLKKDMLTITEKNNRFFITEQQRENNWYENIHLRSMPVIIVKLPKSQSKSLTLHNVDGSSIIQNIILDTLQLETAAGFMNLNNISTSNAKLHSNDGTVTITKSAIDNLSITTRAGDVAIKESTGSGQTIQTDDGQIMITEAIEQPNVYMKSNSGDISIHYKKTPTSLQVTTSGENIIITLPNFDKKTFKIGEGAYNLSAETNYGSIIIE